MSSKKLYPLKCVKCGCDVTVKQLKHDEAKAHIEQDNHFQSENIWYEHTFNCEKLLEKFNKVNYE